MKNQWNRTFVQIAAFSLFVLLATTKNLPAPTENLVDRVRSVFELIQSTCKSTDDIDLEQVDQLSRAIDNLQANFANDPDEEKNRAEVQELIKSMNGSRPIRPLLMPGGDQEAYREFVGKLVRTVVAETVKVGGEPAGAALVHMFIPHSNEFNELVRKTSRLRFQTYYSGVLDPSYNEDFPFVRSLQGLNEPFVLNEYLRLLPLFEMESLSPGAFDGIALNIIESGNQTALEEFRNGIIEKISLGGHRIFTPEFTANLLRFDLRPAGHADPRLQNFGAEMLVRLIRDSSWRKWISSEHDIHVFVDRFSHALAEIKDGEVPAVELIKTLEFLATEESPIARKLVAEVALRNMRRYTYEQRLDIVNAVLKMPEIARSKLIGTKLFKELSAMTLGADGKERPFAEIHPLAPMSADILDKLPTGELTDEVTSAARIEALRGLNALARSGAMNRMTYEFMRAKIIGGHLNRGNSDTARLTTEFLAIGSSHIAHDPRLAAMGPERIVIDEKEEKTRPAERVKPKSLETKIKAARKAGEKP